jgi:hypothetical protein
LFVALLIASPNPKCPEIIPGVGGLRFTAGHRAGSRRSDLANHAKGAEAMPATADHGVIQAGLFHVFNMLDNCPVFNCDLCRKERATFQWSKQQDNRVLRQKIPVCRTCAGMIMLVGKENYRDSDL